MLMRSPFPGMDPYLEHPALWPDVHNSLIAAIRDTLVPLVAPRYFVGIERRTYVLSPDDPALLGRPDVAIFTQGVAESVATYAVAVSTQRDTPVWVEVPMTDEVGETFLELRAVQTGQVVTAIEVLSPANKVSERGRQAYLTKRQIIFESQTNLVEIDLMRVGEAMPARIKQRGVVRGEYNILVSRFWERPRAQLYTFGLRQPIPAFPVPLTRGDEEPELALNDVWHELYTRARYDLQLDYNGPALPPLSADDADWARAQIAALEATAKV